MALEEKTCWLSGAKVVRSGNNDYRLFVYVRTLNNSKHQVRVGKILLVDDAGESVGQLFFPENRTYMLKNVGGADNNLEYGFELSLSADEFEIINCYGMTETCGGCLSFYLDKAYDNTPVGKPLGDMRAYVLDENGNQKI